MLELFVSCRSFHLSLVKENTANQEPEKPLQILRYVTGSMQ